MDELRLFLSINLTQTHKCHISLLRRQMSAVLAPAAFFPPPVQNAMPNEKCRQWLTVLTVFSVRFHSTTKGSPSSPFLGLS